MSQHSIGVVTTGRSKLQEWKTTQKQNRSRKSRGTLTVKWAGSRDKIFSPSGRGRTFFLTSLFIELIEVKSPEAICVKSWTALPRTKPLMDSALHQQQVRFNIRAERAEYEYLFRHSARVLQDRLARRGG